jgi:hypothetical protein
MSDTGSSSDEGFTKVRERRRRLSHPNRSTRYSRSYSRGDQSDQYSIVNVQNDGGIRYNYTVSGTSKEGISGEKVSDSNLNLTDDVSQQEPENIERRRYLDVVQQSISESQSVNHSATNQSISVVDEKQKSQISETKIDPISYYLSQNSNSIKHTGYKYDVGDMVRFFMFDMSEGVVSSYEDRYVVDQEPVDIGPKYIGSSGSDVMKTRKLFHGIIVKQPDQSPTRYPDRLGGRCYIVKTSEGIIEVDSTEIVQWFPWSKLGLTPDVKLTLRDVLRVMWSQLTFRRVSKIVAKHIHAKSRTFIDVNDGNIELVTEPITGIMYGKNPSNYWYKYSFFFGFTSAVHVRQSDPFEGQQIFFDSRNYAELDFESDRSGWFSTDRRLWDCFTAPSQNDLICGIVEQTDKGPSYKRWFKCSEQFLMLYTLLFHPTHNALFYKTKTENKSSKINNSVTTGSSSFKREHRYSSFKREHRYNSSMSRDDYRTRHHDTENCPSSASSFSSAESERFSSEKSGFNTQESRSASGLYAQDESKDCGLIRKSDQQIIKELETAPYLDLLSDPNIEIKDKIKSMTNYDLTCERASTRYTDIYVKIFEYLDRNIEDQDDNCSVEQLNLSWIHG